MKVFTPSGYEWKGTRLARFIERHGYGSLDQLQEDAERDAPVFWDRVVAEVGLEWSTPYTQTLDMSDGIMWPRWFVGGRLDLVDNIVGKHARRHPDKVAVRWEGDAGEERRITYAELAREVDGMAAGLRALGAGEGSRIAIYLPMVPEAAVILLAAAKIGAISVPMFSGYSADSVVQRVQDAAATVLVCANGYFRRGKPVRMLADALAAADACESVQHVVVVDRLGNGPYAGSEHGGHYDLCDYATLAATPADPSAAESFGASDPLMLVYTSGTTGKPKGVVHTHGGFPLKAAQDMVMAFDLREDDTLMWVTDMGWLMGPWMVFGALLLGATIVLCEGTPDYPDAGRLWRIVQRHGVTHLGLSPTLVRLLMGSRDAVPQIGSLDTVRVFGSTGEAWNETPWLWLFETVGQSRRPIVNYSGGTEIGGGILACFPGLPQTACGFNGPIPGMAADVVDAEGKPVRGSVGELVLRQPWPGMTHGFWNDPERYEDTYWSALPGLWVHGDWASIDSDGYWFVHGRSDDTIKVAGKRLGPTEFESALVSHPLVAEAVAVGVPDPIKGEAVVCFVTLHDKRSGLEGWSVWETELSDHVARLLGKPLRPARIHALTQIPKTRNGKILRRVVRNAYIGRPMGDLSSMENPRSIDEVIGLRAARV
ncbi:MAG: AMP-binding protein [Methyloversatilis discipulorum]|uniref:AMP-binding protein n=1 Tax=Methyloversatilis discipulorum TaxID=1119528 RepID=UPI0026E970E1|nr:AMP-binding protein [Methyloversatilis discipulorum]MBV5286436.1 AMP-binding protein [Methyloversatilis discipulorum]